MSLLGAYQAYIEFGFKLKEVFRLFAPELLRQLFHLYTNQNHPGLAGSSKTL